MNTTDKRRWIPSIITAFIVLGCGTALGAGGIIRAIDVSVAWQSPGSATDRFVPKARRDTGDEYLLVVIGASTCNWSSSDQFVRMFREARDSVQAYAQRGDIGFATMAIVQDAVLDDGVDYVRDLGRFDEVAIGRGWRNAALMKYIYGRFPGEAATPQMLVLKREVVGGTGNWGIDGEQVLVRKTGLLQIEQWVRMGSQVPSSSSGGLDGR